MLAAAIARRSNKARANKPDPGRVDAVWRDPGEPEAITELLRQCGRFFTADASHPLPLSNHVLREELSDALLALPDQPSSRQLEEVCLLVAAARADPKVGKLGLEMAYNAYLATKPTLGVNHAINAVLLSLL